MKRKVSKRHQHMTPHTRKHLINQFYIKYYMQQAGNDNPQLKKDVDSILVRLEKLLQ